MAISEDPNNRFDESGSRHQIVAIFETYKRALAARDRLAEEGIPASEMTILDRDAETGTETETNEGVWASIRRLFVPDDDRHGYAEGIDRGHAVLTVRPSSGEPERIASILESFEPIDFDARMDEWRDTGWSGRSAYADTGVAGPGAHPSGSDEVIPVVEEQVRVGKRSVERGGVRVRSYVVERPIEEDVQLREEHVDVERRPVDRSAEVPGDAFRERTIEATAYGEEPVVQKDARVVEEVTLRKQQSERTERVSDKARKQEVEVEDERTDKRRR